jgi:hypothetical protein
MMNKYRLSFYHNRIVFLHDLIESFKRRDSELIEISRMRKDFYLIAVTKLSWLIMKRKFNLE